MPVRSVPSCRPWATLAATLLVSDEAPSVEMTVILSIAPDRRRRRRDDLRQHAEQQVQHGRLAVRVERVGLALHRRGLGVALGQDGRRLGRALPLGRLGQRGAAGPLALTGEAGLLGGGLGGGDGRLALGLGVGDGRVLAGLGLLLHPVPLGVGGLADLGVELALLELGVLLGDLLLLGQDVLLALGLGQRAGRGRLRLGRVDLGLDRRPA